jgi:hypothetical protein
LAAIKAFVAKVDSRRSRLDRFTDPAERFLVNWALTHPYD